MLAAPLLLGGAHAAVNLALALALAGLLLVTLLWRDPGRAVPLTLPVGVVALAWAATLAQLVPLPLALVSLVSPAAYDVVTLADGVSLAPLSLDPPATAHELVKMSGYLAAALLAARLFIERKRRREIAGVIAAGGVVVTILGFVHALAGLAQPYGSFGYPATHFTSSFVNPNHLAAYLGLTSLLSIGMALTAVGRWRWVHLVAATLSGGGVLLTLSRGGIVSYVAALMFLGLALAVDRSQRVRRYALVVQLVLAGALLLAGYLAYTQVARELWTLRSSEVWAKAELWQPVPSMLGAFPALGVGRGAFAAAYARYVERNLPVTFTHLENEWLQTLVDWGAPLGILLILGGAVVFARMMSRAAGRPLRVAAVSGLLFLAVQNVGDFSLTLFAVALPAVVLMVAFAGRPRDRREAPGQAHPSAPLQPWLAPAVTALVIMIAASGVYALYYDAGADTTRLVAALASPDRTLRLTAAASASRRHPADFVLPLLFAERELTERDGARHALPWINRGLYLAPAQAVGHRLAGRALMRLKQVDQAMLEYRLACQAAPAQAPSVAHEAWRLGAGTEHLVRLGEALPQSRRELAAFLLGQGAAKEALALLERGLPDEQAMDALSMRTRAHLALGDLEAALAPAREVEQRWPTEVTGYLLQSSVLVRSADPDGALAALDRGARLAREQAPLLHERARLHLELGRLDRAQEVATTLVERTGGGRGAAAAHWLLGQIYAGQGRSALALREYERARDSDPKNLGYRLGIAALRERLADFRGAKLELERAQSEAGSSAALEDALKRVAKGAAAQNEQLRFELLAPR